jgi:cellulose synthase/poly-beta-1,6-N-acetylglucosamine synthase-like glycosyltransferase
VPQVALAAFVVLVYTYVGYPLLVAALARLSPLRVREDPGWTPRVTACIPVFDVEAHVEAKLESLLALDWPADRLEVLVYDDGSRDGTRAIAERIAERDRRVTVLRGPGRGGKPKGVNAMLAAATGEVLLMTDARQPLVPGALRALVAKLADPRVACVSGNLVLRGAAGAGAYWRYENWIRDKEASFRGMVGVTGPIYAVRRADMAPLPEGVILDDMWVPMRLRLAGRTNLLAKAAVAHDDAFADAREYGRKVRTLAGNYQLFAMLPRLLVPFANPSWFETFSHKILRLVCPWALAVLLAASAWAAWHPPQPATLTHVYVVRPLVGGQAAFYLLAILGPLAGRFGALARTFVVLNTAAVVGLWRFLRGAQKVTW